MSGVAVREAAAGLRAAVEALAGCDLEALTRDELLEGLDELETLWCALPAVRHRMLARLQIEATAAEMGAKNWKQVLAIRWRISTAEAGRRLRDAALLGPRRSLTGEPLEPQLAATAVAQAHGWITAEHVEEIRTATAKLPGFVDAATTEQFEVDLVRLAVGAGPKEVKDSAALALFLLDQDGPEPDDAERARKRSVTKGRQRADGMTPLTAELTPEAAALIEAIYAKYAAPGMCNPDDEQPCTSGTPTQAQIDHDHRSQAQRQHDALVAVLRIALMSGELGELNKLPVQVIIRTTLQDLESRAGIGVSGGGTTIPIADVVRMGAHAHHSLAVFDRATGSALDLFRAKRIASPAQRIMLIARDGGCTKPGCTVGPYGCQAHHATRDWGVGGLTNVDDLGLACGPDNRSVGPGGWTTRMNTRHDVEWIPPAALDTGQHRVNTHHRPELLLRRLTEQPEPPGVDNDTPAKQSQTSTGHQPRNTEPADPQPTTDPTEPGGPAPPADYAA